jgi:hypothetical protein
MIQTEPSAGGANSKAKIFAGPGAQIPNIID